MLKCKNNSYISVSTHRIVLWAHGGIIMKETKNSNEFEKTAVRVSVVSIIGNTLLSVFKLIAGNVK